MSDASTPDYDLVVFGATSFVGQLLTHDLFEKYGLDGEVKWAAAGRSEAKLHEVRDSLGAAGNDLPLIIADASDEDALRKMVESARVIISTVGPYALYGEPLVRICAETGTDYCDLTGEVQWIRRMIDAHEKTAQASGARIVNCCGFDSIPSDMGVWFLQQEAQKRFGQPCSSIKMRVKAIKGGASGGTVASIVNVAKEAAADPALRKELANPYSICPEGHGYTRKQPEVKFAQFDSDMNRWAAPFIMAGINTRIVHRSNALSGNSYGDNFNYDEAMLTGKGIRGRAAAMSFATALAGFVVGAAIKPSRALMEKFALPKPGEGPSPEEQKRGFYDLRFIGRTPKGEILKTKVTGDRDPGYGSTCKILAQAGLSLAFDVSKEEKGGGFWTPATTFDGRFIERLQDKAGLTFEVLEGMQQP